jgi:predicted GNAT family N-acyltransferase
MMMSKAIVKHVISDKQLEDAFQVRTRVFVEEQRVPKELEIDEYENVSEHFVIYIEDQAVGAGRLRPLSEHEAKIERICIDQSQRGKGLGVLIMREVENTAQQKGITTLLLHSQDHAESFYSNLGYKTISEPFDEAGIIHVKMKKELRS